MEITASSPECDTVRRLNVQVRDSERKHPKDFYDQTHPVQLAKSRQSFVTEPFAIPSDVDYLDVQLAGQCQNGQKAGGAFSCQVR